MIDKFRAILRSILCEMEVSRGGGSSGGREKGEKMTIIEPVAIYGGHGELGWEVPQSRMNSQIAVLLREGHAVFETEHGEIPVAV